MEDSDHEQPPPSRPPRHGAGPSGAGPSGAGPSGAGPSVQSPSPVRAVPRSRRASSGRESVVDPAAVRVPDASQRCPACTFEYNAAMNLPMRLEPCGHTLCRSCLVEVRPRSPAAQPTTPPRPPPAARPPPLPPPPLAAPRAPGRASPSP